MKTGVAKTQAHASAVGESHLSAGELADREGVPLNSVYQWNLNGTGPRFMRIGKYVRYRLADVIEWEESRLDPRPAA